MFKNRPGNDSSNRGSTGLAEMYGRFAVSLYQYALLLLEHVSDAEDVVQTVFVRLAETNNLGNIKNLQTYLYRATRNEIYSLLRQRKRRRRDLALPDVEQLLVTNPKDNEILRDQVQQALLILPTKQREVVVLKVYHEMTFREIGKVVSCSANTAASRYRYAGEKLVQLLSDRNNK